MTTLATFECEKRAVIDRAYSKVLFLSANYPCIIEAQVAHLRIDSEQFQTESLLTSHFMRDIRE
jgi:hypothetical protein